MMRSMYSAIAGLKAHQTKMDVIGNNIANVNTAGFKASNVVFSDVYYQTLQSATGANTATGAAGQNAKQVGLGSKLTSITTNISTQGGAQATDNAMDLMLSGDGFFIVNQGGTNYFTKAGAFNVDAAGNLCTSTGAMVMGWDVDENNEIVKSQVKSLDVMSPENLYSEPAATTKAYLSGNIDSSDPQLTGEGVPFTVNFYDNLGYSYTAVFSVTSGTIGTDGKFTPNAAGEYTVTLTDILDSDSKSILKTVGTDGKETATGITASATTATTLTFDKTSGQFEGIGGKDTTALKMTITGTGAESFPAEGVTIDFSSLTQYSTSGTSSVTSTRGDKLTGEGAGTAYGSMKGISIESSGKIYGTYDNGTKKLLGQIAVASFSNPAGLESIGNSMFAETQNSGEFDGIGQDVSTGGGSMSSGYLEMSNVDLSTEFTNMITTQRGFQANSRIITTSDTLLEELVNLKR